MVKFFGTLICIFALSQLVRADPVEELAQEVGEMMKISPSVKKVGLEGIDQVLQTPLYEVKVTVKKPTNPLSPP